MNDPVKLLAAFLTGPEVIVRSMELQLPKESMTRKSAAQFFRLRQAYGVSGYATREEAVAAIERTITRTAAKIRGD